MSQLFVATLVALTAGAAVKPTISFKPLSDGEDERPVITTLVASPQGTDYGFKIEFNKIYWGEACKGRCANATIFLDTDNSKGTGLKLSDPKAEETGADIAIVIQGTRSLREGESKPVLKVKVLQFSESARQIEEGEVLSELDPIVDSERVLSSDTSLLLLVDANQGSQPAGKQLRIIYHPPDSKPLVGITKGLASPASGRVELFKDGKLTNPVVTKKKKSDYEKL